MILLSEQCSEVNVGPKAYTLAQLQKLGLPVPTFVAISFDSVFPLAQEDLERIRTLLGDGLVAVRSASSGEDTSGRSMAGQFLTSLSVPLDDLIRVTEEVIRENAKRAPEMKHSLIIQKMLEPVCSGVIFTRSPQDPFCLQIDSVSGLGESLVSGKKSATNVFLSRRVDVHQQLPAWQKELANYGMLSEEYFGHPQDLEWCKTKDGVMLVQSRAITSVTKEDELYYRSCEECIPKHAYQLEQTGYSELAPNAETEMVRLLKTLFQSDGPVQRAYRELGFLGKVKDPLVVIGNTVFTDKDKEQFLFSSGVRGWWNTLKLTFVKSQYQTIQHALKQRIEHWEAPAVTTKEEAWKEILTRYSLIVKAGIVAESLSKYAAYGKQLFNVLPHVSLSEAECTQPPVDVKGNLFSLYDQTAFIASVFSYAPQSNVKTVQERYALAEIRSYAIREYARWYAVQLMTWYRTFYTTKELVPTHTVKTRLPRMLSTDHLRKQDGITVLVDGDGEGMVIDIADLAQGKSGVVLVDTLSPDLAQYQLQLKGILTRVGSGLSHMAIVAREWGIPVLRIGTDESVTKGKRMRIVNGRMEVLSLVE